jgi:hypothetical protein
MKNQGLAHLASIFVLPVLVIAIYFSPVWLKIILAVLLFGFAYLVWKKIK